MSQKTSQRILGKMRAGLEPDVAMMICTAGHVDHGKTRLVGLLTGCQTDRLKVEQERGLTIELGFAPCFLGGELCVGIVDVPGHEKFIKNMVAGVSGIGLALLVIAADDGIMPQTVEHFQILELLRVRHGLIALTKTDLVTPERVVEVTDQIRRFFKGTFFEDAPIRPVSSETGEGYAEFYQTLVERIKGLAARERRGVFRMPVERVFTQPGYGQVATGIPLDGAVRVGDRVELVPGGRVGKVRGIQRFLHDSEDGRAGQCLALNIPDFSKEPPTRGQVLCRPGCLQASQILHVEARAVPGLDPPLRNAESVKLHTGTSETPGKLFLLEDKLLEAGGAALATVVLAQPVAAAPGDAYILRRPSPAATVAGGEILAVEPGPRRPRKSVIVPRLRRYRELLATGDPHGPDGLDRRVEHCLIAVANRGASREALSRGTLLTPEAVAECLERLLAAQRVIALQADCFVAAEVYAELRRQLEERVKELAAGEGALSCAVNDVRPAGWPAPLWQQLSGELERAGLIARKGERLLLRPAGDKIDVAEAELLRRLLALYEEGGFSSPRPDEAPELLRAPPPKVAQLIEHLCNQGELVRLNKNVMLSGAHFRRAQELVVRLIQERGALDSGEFKNDLGSTRKYALAILDFLDGRGVTLRAGNLRKLKPTYQSRLF